MTATSRTDPVAIDGLNAVTAPAARTVDERLARFFDEQASRWDPVRPALSELTATLRQFVLNGGKRLRASFCIWGWRAASPWGPEALNVADAAVVDVAAALELLHAFALIHDDVMDGTDRRRDRPALHHQMEKWHAAQGWCGEGRRFGEGLAVLLGDAALAWADCLLAPHRLVVGPVWDQLRVELMMGQYLDVVEAASGGAGLDDAWIIARLKSARYSVTRPLQLGAAVGGRLDDLRTTYTQYGDPIGEAFQLRDDLLGLYGEPALTGKPIGEDLRKGKPTVLAALASVHAPAAAGPLLARIGRPDLDADDVAELCDLFDACGATELVEEAIAERVELAMAALDGADLEEDGRQALERLAHAAAWRVR